MESTSLTFADPAGLNPPLSDQVATLTQSLARAAERLAGPETAVLTNGLVERCRTAATAADYAAVQDRLSRLDEREIAWILRMGLTWFELLNAAERQEMARVNHERATAEGDAGPVPESLDQAIVCLKERGVTLDELVALLHRLDIQPTLTAHPTETKRATVRAKLSRIEWLLERLQDPSRTATEEQAVHEELDTAVTLLLSTEHLRATKPEPEAEVESGLKFLLTSIWESAAGLHLHARHALRRHYGADVAIPDFLRFRSWAGGDRDGNANVTPEVTRRTLAAHRRAALERHLGELADLQDELSLSDRHAAIPLDLLRSLDADRAERTLDAATRRRWRHEPYRLKIAAVMTRLSHALEETRDGANASGPAGYGSAEYVRDLELIERSLVHTGYGHVARGGRLQRVLWLARTFGFHLAALDIRQHSAVHERAVADILRAAGLVADYASLTEERRRDALAEALRSPRPVTEDAGDLACAARESLAVMDVVREALARDPRSVGAYVISMADAVSDMLEVLLLAKEAGLWHDDGEGGFAPLDIVPLFETVADLAAVETTLDALLAHPAYRRQLDARGPFQEVMIGYSDSNKDGGYWMANWQLMLAQERIARLCRGRGIAFRLFHGRGGSLERGGGLESDAMLAAAPLPHNGRLRFTEQGEVISFRYASRALARRHLEQVVHAAILAMVPDGAGAGAAAAKVNPARDAFAPVAERAMATYRRLIEQPAFPSWFAQATPVQAIGRLPIASRPAARGRDETRLDELRAIPWVFAWRQARYAVPGWFGLGTAFRELGAEPDALRALYRDDPFMRLVVDHAAREMARTRLKIARYYSAGAEARGAAFRETIERDFRETRAVLLRVTGRRDLLEGERVLRVAIAFRDAALGLMNLIQVELMRREHERDGRSEDAGPLLLLSIATIAAGMESAG
jgi:phosphoenolpyruvate carboxylase